MVDQSQTDDTLSRPPITLSLAAKSLYLPSILSETNQQSQAYQHADPGLFAGACDQDGGHGQQSASTGPKPPGVTVDSLSFLEASGLQDLPVEDFAFLYSRGCFTLPEPRFLDDFMRCYFLYVHPCLPLMDEGRFWSLYTGQKPAEAHSQSMSLLLFRAMLFASSPVVVSPSSKSLPKSV